MAKAIKTISTYQDVPIEKTVEFVGLIDPKRGGSRWKDDRTNKWHFVAQLVAWQANEGPVLHDRMFIRKGPSDKASAGSLMRQTRKGRMIQFAGRRPRRLGSYQNTVDIVGPIGKTKISFVSEHATKELLKPRAYNDKVFGRLRFDEKLECFACEKSFRGSKLRIDFKTDDIDELQAMLPVAKKLWAQRDKWFSRWRDRAYRYYVEQLVDEWWQGDQKLTRSLFNKHLGWPCGLTFSIREDTVYYCLTGLSDELYGDHGIDGGGTNLSDMEMAFV